MKKHTMNRRTYEATVRKLHTAYVALAAACDTAEFFQAERIDAAMAAMSRVPDALRVQVCQRCSVHGYYSTKADPYTSRTCTHDEVPRYDIRTGERKYGRD